MTDPRLMEHQLKRFQRFSLEGKEIMKQNNKSIRKIEKIIKKCSKGKGNEATEFSMFESFPSQPSAARKNSIGQPSDRMITDHGENSPGRRQSILSFEQRKSKAGQMLQSSFYSRNPSIGFDLDRIREETELT